jgi:ribulose-phosphate 3-epimerase
MLDARYWILDSEKTRKYLRINGECRHPYPGEPKPIKIEYCWYPIVFYSDFPLNYSIFTGEVMKKLIAPSILSADFTKLGEEVRSVEAAGADWIHTDVMDGHFVPNITLGPMIVAAVRKVTELPIDVHLMIENPERYIPDFAKAGANYISVQVETSVHLDRTVNLIKECGARAGVVLNPSTPLATLEWILEQVDYVLIMSVNPGFGGQKFIRASLEKLSALQRMIQQRGESILIEIDGGVNEKTIAEVSRAGADVFVAGSAIFGSSNYKKTIENFRKLIAG